MTTTTLMMTTIAFAIPQSSLRLLFLGGSAAILYIVGRLMMGVIPRRLDGSTLRAMLGLMPVLIVAIVAVIMRRPQVGLHLPIAAAAGAITFGLGAIVLGRSSAGASGVGLRSWMFVLPAVALVLIGGFGGRADGAVLSLLAAFGVTALSAWLPDRPIARAATLIAVDAPTPSPTFASSAFGDTVITETSVPQSATPPVATVMDDGGSRPFAMIIWVACGLLAVLAGCLAILGLPALESMRHVSADGLITIFLLAPAIVVPLVFELLPPCRPIGWTASISTLTKFAVMCLCIALPAAVLVAADVDVLRGLLHVPESSTAAAPSTQPTNAPLGLGTTGPATTPTTPTTMTSGAISSTQSSTTNAPTLNFPSLPALAMSTDLLVLAAASLLLLPVAGGWLRPGKLEAAALFACYVMNLMLVLHAMFS